MTAPEPGGVIWHRSSYSYGSGNCVELAPAPDTVLVRDSKNHDSPALRIPTTAWRAFLTTLPADPAHVREQRPCGAGSRPGSLAG
ncbi:MAG: DUF397 domain-containing protein [Pseudonocardiaceae bacterium]